MARSANDKKHRKKGKGSYRARAGGHAMAKMFTSQVRVDEAGNAVLQGLQSRAERRRPDRLAATARGTRVGDRRYPGQPPAPTEAPPAWKPPPKEWQEEVGALEHYTGLFEDGGGELEQACTR